METSTIVKQEQVQKPTIHRKPDVYSFLGLIRPGTGTFSGEWHNNKQCSFQRDAY
jgi:hypothetical protein